MITHNGKQVSIAMRNRKAINLIARNGKAMFGELEDLNRAGIDAAAKAVIVAEYGKQVWSDVKQYAKAHPQIVEFINQDPHLAPYVTGALEPNAANYPIQLGLRVTKDFGYTFKATDVLEFSFKQISTSKQWHDFLVARSAWDSSNAIGYIYNFSNKQLLVSTTSGSSQINCLSPTLGTWYTIKQDMRKGIYVDGVLKISNVKSSTWKSDGTLGIIADTQDRISVNFINVYSDDVLVHRFLPLNEEGTWWDVVEGVFC